MGSIRVDLGIGSAMILHVQCDWFKHVGIHQSIVDVLNN